VVLERGNQKRVEPPGRPPDIDCGLSRPCGLRPFREPSAYRRRCAGEALGEWARRHPGRDAHRSGAEAAARALAPAPKKERSGRGPLFRGKDFEEQLVVAGVAADGEPLHLVLIGVGIEAQQLGDAAVDVARESGSTVRGRGPSGAGGLPAGAATQVAAAIEVSTVPLRRRGVIGRSRMGAVWPSVRMRLWGKRRGA